MIATSLCFYFAIGILFCTANGLKMIQILAYYGLGLAPICLLLAEIVFICWISDFTQLEHYLQISSKTIMHKIISVYFKYVLLILVALGIVITFVSDCLNPLNLAAHYQVIGWVLFLIPLLAIIFSLVIAKKTFLCCMAKQMTEGHIIDLNLEPEE